MSQRRKAQPRGIPVSHLQSSTPNPTHSLVAAALQDHLSKQYSLSLATPISSSRSRGGPGGVRQEAPPTSSPHRGGGDGVRLANTTVMATEHKRNPKKYNHSSSSSKSNRVAGVSKREYVLDKAPPPLSLAQRLGLVGAPPQPLDERSWRHVKQQSNSRQDSAQPCPICQEGFGLTTQVLLSCSHVFHLACLTAFEKFSQKKRCPLCRTENYQRRVVYEGAQYWRHRAATLIQARWRGYLVRCWYLQYRDKVPPSHPTLRARHFEKKLSTLTQTMVDSCQQCSSQAQNLLDQSDANLAAARQAMRLCDLQLKGVTAEREELDWEGVRERARCHLTTSTECPVCLYPLISQPHPQHLQPLPPPQPHPQDSNHSSNELSLQHNNLQSKSERPRPLSVLSCGHVLHEVCIEAMERFSGEDTLHLCPLCRTPYHRTPLSDSFLSF